VVIGRVTSLKVVKGNIFFLLGGPLWYFCKPRILWGFSLLFDLDCLIHSHNIIKAFDLMSLWQFGLRLIIIDPRLLHHHREERRLGVCSQEVLISFCLVMKKALEGTL
jgi:hypothetical protein